MRKATQTPSRTRGLLLCLCCVLGVTACATAMNSDPADLATPGSEMSEPGDPGALTITPPTFSVTTSGEAINVPLTVTGAKLGDVTAQATITIDDSALATIKDKALQVPAGLLRGGRAILTARLGGQVATAPVTVRLVLVDRLDNGVPPEASSFFGADTSGPPPLLTYPITDTLLPVNLVSPLLQVQAPASTILLRLKVDCPTFAMTLYRLQSKACVNQLCTAPLTDSDWRSMTTSCAGGEVTLQVATSPGQAKPIGVDKQVRLRLTRGPLLSTLYYNSIPTAAGARGLWRTTVDNATPKLFRPALTNPQDCVGCHVVSTNGKRISVSYGYDIGGGVLDGTNGIKALIGSNGARWSFSSFNPAGDQVLVTSAGKIFIVDSGTGQRIAEPSTMIADLVGGAIDMAQWSPDGQRVLFVRAPANSVAMGEQDQKRSATGDLMLMGYSGGEFSLPTMLLAKGPTSYHMYPSYTDDGQYVLYNTAQEPCKNGNPCNTYAPDNTFLRIMKPVVGSPITDLKRAWQVALRGSNAPRSAPELVDGKYLFFSFHSRLPYGSTSTSGPQVWLAAIDMDLLKQDPSQDPSSAPFWLPGQDTSAPNVTPTWTKVAGCTATPDCPGGQVCLNMQCVRQVQ